MYLVMYHNSERKLRTALFAYRDDLLAAINGPTFAGIIFAQAEDEAYREYLQFYQRHLEGTLDGTERNFKVLQCGANYGVIFKVDLALPFPKIVKEWNI